MARLPHVLLLSLLVVTSSARGAGVHNLTIRAILVDEEMKPRPVPLHAVNVVSSTGDTIRARTDLEGTATVQVMPGSYMVSSVTPIRFQSRTYGWSIPVRITDADVTVALSNDNAVVAGEADSRQRVDSAADLYTKLRRGVFRVEAGLAHGTGFLADTLGGVILTNAHVVERVEPTELAVALDSGTRVRAQLLARDSDADIAVLRVNPDRIADRPRIVLQRVRDEQPVVPGERLAALGFPLHQDLTITTGIASSVRAGAIISDVNINPGNSGGPLVNVDGEVVAVNTFGDVSERGGPGVSGSVLISRAGPALARAAAEASLSPPPPAYSLPVLPSDRLAIASLKAYADRVDVKKYQESSISTVGPFDVTIQTPVQTFVAIKAYERDVAKDRKKREAKAGIPESQRYSEVRDYRDWAEYVGDQTTPVVSLSIVPRIGETGGSLFRRFMLGPNMRATYRFEGDVRGAVVYRNGAVFAPILGGHAPVKVFQEDRWVSLKDVADQGMYVFDVELLRPDSTGVPPSIVVAIRDLKQPEKLRCLEFSAEAIAQAWNDFEGFFAEQRPGAGFRKADAKGAKKRKSAQSSRFLKGECRWPVQDTY